MKRTLLYMAALAVIVFTFQSCSKSKTVEAVPTISIAGLFSLTGNWSSLGKSSTGALKVASDDINYYLSAKNAPFRINVLVADTKLDTTTAKNLFTQAKAAGISFIIGPQSSAELAALKPLIDASKVLVVSQSSTAGSLAVAGDNIFRFCPSDAVEGAAIASTIYGSGIRGLVTVARDDAGNKGLQTSTGTNFTTKGGEVQALTAYSATTPNFASVITELKTKVAQLTATHGAGKVGVYLASFDECIDLFKLANAEPSLKAVKWFGGDGVVLSTALTADAAAADFAIATGFFAPSYGLSPTYESKWKPVATKIKEVSGVEADAFALAAYDALWTIALTIEKTFNTNDDFAALKTKFVAEANSHTGITGPDGLNAAGDRSAGTYDYFGLTKEGTTYKWVLTGKSTDL